MILLFLLPPCLKRSLFHSFVLSDRIFLASTHEKMQSLLIYVRRISLTLMSSQFHPCCFKWRIPLIMAEQYFIMHISCILIIYSSTDGRLGWFHFLVIVNDATICMGGIPLMHVFYFLQIGTQNSSVLSSTTSPHSPLLELNQIKLFLHVTSFNFYKTLMSWARLASRFIAQKHWDLCV